ncbi:hypothetical protein CANINC_004019 [Pichia inconspicua]|uniref:Uncharacterized protein n=1 Tax=Pichia inconspicua TaxID=52247 RepID=A0A4T0WX70_9ASCO|nr:hypothetical protein CANINC_004019 [[Candida] inconspicua]
MAGITPVKFISGVLLVAVPLFATTYYSRPTFANAINHHLIQEELEAKRQHNYKTDYYEKDESKDELLKNYVKKGTGKARDFHPTYN